MPSWLLEYGRLDSILSVEAGGLWEKLITTWVRQERRLGFGLNEDIVSSRLCIIFRFSNDLPQGVNLSLVKKPKILGEYFKWRHNPSKGYSIVVPEFGEEVMLWWTSIQPEWRSSRETSPDDHNDYSYMLAGGKKGVFLILLCLAWWDRAYAQNVGRLKAEHLAAVEAAAKDDVTPDLCNLPDHDPSWLTIINDLIFVLELAHGWPTPTKGPPEATGVVSGRRKRAADGANTAARKKKRP